MNINNFRVIIFATKQVRQIIIIMHNILLLILLLLLLLYYLSVCKVKSPLFI